MNLYKLLILLYFSLISLSAIAQDRSKEIDAAYAKLVAYLPEGAQLIHVPYTDKLMTYGPNHNSTRPENTDVTGGKSLIVDVYRRGKNPWDDAVFADIGGELKEGEVIYMMLWLRLASDSKTDTLVLPKGGIQLSGAPYSQVLERSFNLTKKWQTFAVAKRTNKAYSANEIRINIPVANQVQKLEFGPVFVFNLGRNVELSDLPFIE